MYRCLFILLLFSSACLNQEKDSLSQEIKNWKFEYKNDWHKAEVPGNNFSDLLNHGFILDPFYGTNEDSVQWIAGKSWNYRSKFNVSANTLSKKNQILCFNGLDTYAKVYLNNSLILEANNMFRTWNIDVKNILKKENNLIIKYNSTNKVEKQKQITLGYNLPGRHRVFTRKAGYHYGWDWGPKINPTGIWRKVELKSWDGCKIKDVYIAQDNLTDSLANLSLGIEIESTEKKIIAIKAYDKKWEKFILEEGNNKLSIIIRIPKPELWWPHGYGNQKLYDIPIYISNGQDEN